MKNDEQLARNFNRVGNAFIRIHNSQELDKYNLDFNPSAIQEKSSRLSLSLLENDVHVCDTVACHGGWGLVLFGKPEDHIRSYSAGAYLIARELGFHSERYYTKWANDNPDIWGNINGGLMFGFIGYVSFKKPKNECTLKDIGLHYKAVARRIRKTL